MGELIMMTRRSFQARRDAPNAEGASILFFTGVRYARMPEPDEALASVTPRRRGKARRVPKTTDMKRA